MSIVIDFYNQLVSMQGFAPYIVIGVILLYLISRNKSKFKEFLATNPVTKNYFRKKARVFILEPNGYLSTDFKEVTSDGRLKFSSIPTENTLKNPKIVGKPLYDEASKKHVYFMQRNAPETMDWDSKVKSTNELDDMTLMMAYVAGQQVAAHNLKPFSIDKKTLYIVIFLIFSQVANVAIGWMVLQNLDKLAKLMGYALN